MRISDWSSDVCSSDLVGHSHNLLHCRKLLLSRRVEFIRDLHCEVLLANRHMQHTPKRSPTETIHKANLLIVVDQRLAVRKSVVSGKRGAVSVDLGGRCIIKNNKQIHYR